MTRARTNADNATLGVTLSGSETLSAKTLTAPIINASRISSPSSISSISATGAGSTVQFDVATTNVLYYSIASTSNWTLNIRGTAAQTLNNFMTTNDTLTVVFLATNGVTPYYMNALTIDGNSVTPQWNSGTAPTAGNASGIDEYVFNITKTASNTYIVRASGSISEVTKTTTQTLTNKTLTTPIISSISNTGLLTLPTSTDTLVARTTTDTLTNKYLQSPNEVVQIIGTGFAGYTFDVLSGGVVYITANSTANGTINFRGNGSTTLASVLAVGQSVSCVLAITNSTAYYPTAFQIDGSAVTPKWSGGTAPSAGNASAIDAYTFTIIKTAATPTYTVLAGGAVKFA